MKKGLVITVFVLMIVIPMALAIPTKINIKTLPNHDVDVSFLAPSESEYNVYNLSKQFSDYYGDISFEYEIDKAKFSIGVFVKQDGKKVMYERFDDDFHPGDVINLEVVPENYEIKENPFKDKPATEVVEEVEVNSTDSTDEGVNVTIVAGGTEVVEEAIDSDSKITGNVISNVTEIFNKSKFYLLGGLLVLIVLGILINVFRNPVSAEMRKAALHSDDRPPTILTDKELEDAERRLKVAEIELADIKAKFSKKSAAEEKYKAARKALDEAQKEIDVSED
ncbi:hypothetical protein COU53_03915 [Candidatus Pacearchaeota archaeon CG10_big_fil_rev_8_21_14_0_10_30_48]|nr:MAG: hypothetical protein COU53_03915 [Candidatus Pacearchaeota archaeon CG10_big_fil_rev_8_21_14_0_10_30_48]